MTAKEKKGAQVRRCFLICDILVENVAYGLTNKEIADATRTSAVNAHRDLELLESMGEVRRRDNGRWVLTTKPLARHKKYEQAHSDMIARANEVRENITAAATRRGG